MIKATFHLKDDTIREIEGIYRLQFSCDGVHLDYNEGWPYEAVDPFKVEDITLIYFKEIPNKKAGKLEIEDHG